MVKARPKQAQSGTVRHSIQETDMGLWLEYIWIGTPYKTLFFKKLKDFSKTENDESLNTNEIIIKFNKK